MTHSQTTTQASSAQNRYRLLNDICNYGAEHPVDNSEEAIISHSITALLKDPQICLIWFGKRNSEHSISATQIFDKNFTQRQTEIEQINQFLAECSADCSALQALETCKPVPSNTLQKFIDNSEHMASLLQSAEAQSAISLPLHYGKHVYGILTVYTRQPGGFLDDDYDFMIQAAAVISQTLYVNEMNRRLSHERGNKSSRPRWQSIFTAMQDPALIVTDQGEIIDVNPSIEVAANKKREEIIGKGVCEILHGGRSPGTTCPLELILQDKKNRMFETELRGLQGNYLLTISPLNEFEGKKGINLLLARDLTEEQLLKAEAMRAAQLASIGELAAGVAHEINNPINGIINYAQILKDAEISQETNQFLDRIIKEGKRIAGITKNLLDFSRKSESEPEPVLVTELIQSCIDLIKHQLTIDGIALSQEYQDDLPRITCDPQQIQQVLLNIFSNARYAVNERHSLFPELGKKTLLIEALQKKINGRSYVKIRVTDNGTGIEHDIIDRVMDPFFSTKKSGHGTGLGLSISHSLVRDNSGLIRLQSEKGKFTSVIIDLPVFSGDYQMRK